MFKGVQANRAVTVQTALASALYAAQACLSVFVILHTYQVLRISNPLWALVSAVLILQPGLNQSLSNSLTRVTANGVGMLTGAIVQLIHGHGYLGLCEGLIITIAICEVFRLDQGLRTACSTLIIVMLPAQSGIFGRGEQRVQAVAIGCAVGLGVQLLTSGAFKLFEKIQAAQSGANQVLTTQS